MPVDIDQIDTEIEITRPSRAAASRVAPASGVAPSPPAASARDTRRLIVAALEDELEAYLRTHG